MPPRIVLAMPFLILAAVVSAQDASAQTPPPPRQEGTAELAFVGTSGNTSTSTFSAGAEHIARPDGWLVKNRLLAVRSTSEGDLTASSFLYAFRTERALTSRISAVGEYGFFRDTPAGVSSRNTFTGGLAYKVVDLPRQSLVADAGIGYLNEQRITGADVSSATYSGGTLYKVKLSETADLTDEARLLGTFDRGADWRLAHTIAVTARLNSLFSLKVSNVLRYAHFPPPGFKTTDTTTSIALVASFKRQ